MKNKKLALAGILLIGIILVSGCINETKKEPSEAIGTQTATPTPTTLPLDDKTSNISRTGTVKFNDFEGGFYGIISDAGEHYDPINLGKEFQVDGLRVRFEAKIRKDLGSIHMWGTLIEIIKIEKLDR
jgi:hypothetical protein